MDDRELLHTIEKLVSEEHELMQEAEEGQLDDTKHSRMREIEVSEKLILAQSLYLMPPSPYEKQRNAAVTVVGEKLADTLLDEINNVLVPVLDGEEAFKLYDTFGLPMDFIVDTARDRGVAIDQQGFEDALQRQRERAPRPPGPPLS